MSGKTAFKTECSPWPPPIESCYYDLAASARLLRYKDSFSQNITADILLTLVVKKTTFLRLSTLPLLVTLMDRIFSVLPDHNKLKLAPNETKKVKI